MNNRGTGRTTAMLANAERLAREGHRVIVVAASNAHKRLLMSEVTHPQVAVISSDAPGFDWNRGGLIGYKDCVFLIDHFTYEKRIRDLESEIYSLRRKLEEKPLKEEEAPFNYPDLLLASVLGLVLVAADTLGAFDSDEKRQ